MKEFCLLSFSFVRQKGVRISFVAGVACTTTTTMHDLVVVPKAGPTLLPPLLPPPRPLLPLIWNGLNPKAPHFENNLTSFVKHKPNLCHKQGLLG